MYSRFFEKELFNIQQRFNETFGRQPVCNVQTKCLVIFSIIKMGMLSRKITTADKEKDVKNGLQKLVRYQRLLNKVFDKFEANIEERRDYKNVNKDREQDQSSVLPSMNLAIPNNLSESAQIGA